MTKRKPPGLILLLSIYIIMFSELSAQSAADWFEFRPGKDNSGSRINMKHWLDTPAGRHGFVNMKGSGLYFDDGRQIKFWGVNVAGNNPFPTSNQADRWAAFIASYGINAVRFHKFTWEATDGVYSTQLKNDKWKNFDYFSYRLKKLGIYTGWSHIYGHRVLPGDSGRLLAYKEVAATRFPWSHLNGTTASLVNFAPDLQELNIELTVNMLNHRNPHTGLRYADDPALAFVELQNEDNIFWGAINETLKQTPTYKTLLCNLFSDYLLKKYKSDSALVNAWGRSNLPPDESLEKRNVFPQPNHGFFSSQSEKAWTTNQKLPQHVIDKAMFLYEQQQLFYSRFVTAIRATGYKGLIIGSCWQAGSGLAHLLNLHADYQAGVIDRHNYSGGGTGHSLKPGNVQNQAMVAHPGSGLLSTGFQQVKDRPFFLSEWMSLIPNEWTAESAPIVAVYGLGLQDWDGSFAFAMDHDRFTPTIQSGHGVYNVTSPTQLALYPALAAMVYRGDVKPAEIIAQRNVEISELAEGRLPFFEKVEQQSDVKQLQSTVPLSALAQGRVVLSFEKTPGKKANAGVVPVKQPSVVSTTGQLEWFQSPKGYFTLNTSGIQGAVGFSSGNELKFRDLNIKTQNEFSVVLIHTNERNNGITSAKSIIVTTVARARNTGMQYNDQRNQLLETGEAPILLEPVVVELQLKKRRNKVVYVLDHVGNRTGQKVPESNGRYILDGRKYKAIYYEIAAE
ncbi:hypothetical protein ACX0G7_01465 [Flavitalea antarctica]